MSRLLVVTTPDVVIGFQLAGVGAYAAKNSGEAQRLIESWLAAGEIGLLAIDEKLYLEFDAAFRQRLNEADQLPHLVIPDGLPAPKGATGVSRIAQLLREAIGFQITFQGEQA